MIIHTQYGALEGTSENGCTVFRGVPYAKPPIGPLRFHKPEPPEPWEGVRSAKAYSNRSLQRANPRDTFYKKEFYSHPDFQTGISEDCLYLNLWVPEGHQEEKLPVAVYVHGGAFLSGAGSNLPFVGTELAKAGVIVVTLNYRLGALGFLCHPLLAEPGKTERGGNYGLWDQLAAIRWLKENIAFFGGDPDNITAFGQSAGAMSLQALAVSPASEGLISKMILQSGGGYHNPLGEYRRPELAEDFSEDLLEALGQQRGGWAESAEKRQAALDALYGTSEAELLDAIDRVYAKAFSNFRGMPFVPVIDGELIPEDGNERIDMGKFLHIPYILGCNGDDLTAADNPEERCPDTIPMHKADVELAKRANALPGGRAYTYYFDRKLPGDDAGAFHSAELWYVFGSLPYCWRPFTDADYALSRRMVRHWSNFMKCGDPNGPDGGEWRRCTAEDPYYLYLNAGDET